MPRKQRVRSSSEEKHYPNEELLTPQEEREIANSIRVLYVCKLYREPTAETLIEKCWECSTLLGWENLKKKFKTVVFNTRILLVVHAVPVEGLARIIEGFHAETLRLS
jgi:hypothetical protein